jgi:hypothetical protein
MAVRTYATACPQLAKADAAFQAHPFGQPTETCLRLTGTDTGTIVVREGDVLK